MQLQPGNHGYELAFDLGKLELQNKSESASNEQNL